MQASQLLDTYLKGTNADEEEIDGNEKGLLL